ncbi:MAG: CDP-alcohol phosphatidyltransferase [Pseudopedobacter saltans]|uniref:CDP-alcohol phosphatidyltransferase n=1 Tax=Pseudopedobacter saltans TaxID=151895 RepID=A0A2W5F4X7_9SPHI|nr:MAG: CDP-alcohol phosphatidyltransferase [Pseudopedobacter saltans]
MKQIANGFTLLNLVFGCMAIYAAIAPGFITTMDSDGISTFVILPEKIYLASVFIGCAAIIDFLDGFIARLLNAASPMGKELDSLADVVSFGVAPSMIAIQFLKLSFAKDATGIDTNILWLLPAFLLPTAGAIRLARFNLDTTSSSYFKGVPIPAAGILVASFPLIYWFCNIAKVNELLSNSLFWYALILVVSGLMVSKLPMFSLKFKHFSLKNDWPIVLLAVIAVIGSFTIGWLTVPSVFALYVLFSLFFIKKKDVSAHTEI